VLHLAQFGLQRRQQRAGLANLGQAFLAGPPRLPVALLRGQRRMAASRAALEGRNSCCCCVASSRSRRTASSSAADFSICALRATTSSACVRSGLPLAATSSRCGRDRPGNVATARPSLRPAVRAIPATVTSLAASAACHPVARLAHRGWPIARAVDRARLILRGDGRFLRPAFGEASLHAELRFARLEALFRASFELVVVAQLQDFGQDAAMRIGWRVGREAVGATLLDDDELVNVS